MIQVILQASQIIACMGVLAGCFCRIGIMNSRRNRWAWFFLYALFAVYALGTMVNSVHSPRMGWDDAAGIAGMLTYLMLTRRRWKDGSPPETNRGGL